MFPRTMIPHSTQKANMCPRDSSQQTDLSGVLFYSFIVYWSIVSLLPAERNPIRTENLSVSPAPRSHGSQSLNVFRRN